MKIELNTDDLEPLVKAIVTQVLDEYGAKLNRHMTEPEAAGWLGVNPHTLRDARKRGELEFSRVGRFVRYTQQQLNDWVQRKSTPEKKA